MVRAAQRSSSKRTTSKSSNDQQSIMAMEIDKLRHELVRALSSTVADTVETVCEEYEETFTAAAAKSFPFLGKKHMQISGEDGEDADYDTYYNCCRRLVTYITENMVTSPDFIQQMDRIILACHSNASERVLRSVAKKSLWFHRKDSNEDDEEEEEEEEEEEVPPRRQKPSPRRSMKEMQFLKHTSGTKRRATPPPPIMIPSKRQKQVNNHGRVTARRSSVAYNETTTDDEEDDEEEDVENRKPRRNHNRIQESDSDASEGDEEDEVVSTQPHYDQTDELLSFKDAIGDMCYIDRRTPAQTRFLKDRLRKAIQFVDAQLCKPPKGHQCAWECKKIRKQMCSLNLPCRNKICRLWHDVEAHTDRCHNTHCEFRIRVMLRETMYKMDHKQLEIESIQQEIEQKKKDKAALKYSNDRDQILDRRVIVGELDQFKQDLETAEREFLVLKATKKAYWTTLGEIGITPQDDVTDKFPPYNAHYVAKKTPVKRKPVTPTKKASSETPLAMARADRVRRRRGSSSVAEEEEMIPNEAFSPPAEPRQRITRRSTQQSLKTMASGVIELDDDDEEEEKKSVENEPKTTEEKDITNKDDRVAETAADGEEQAVNGNEDRGHDIVMTEVTTVDEAVSDSRLDVNKGVEEPPSVVITTERVETTVSVAPSDAVSEADKTSVTVDATVNIIEATTTLKDSTTTKQIETTVSATTSTVQDGDKATVDAAVNLIEATSKAATTLTDFIEIMNTPTSKVVANESKDQGKEDETPMLTF